MEIFNGGQICYPLLIDGSKYNLLVTKVSETHIRIEFNYYGNEENRRSADSPILATVLITHIRSGIPTVKSHFHQDINTTQFLIEKMIGEHPTSHLVVRFWSGNEDWNQETKLTLAEIPEEERRHSPAHHNTNMLLKHMILQLQRDLQHQEQVHNQQLNSMYWDFQQFRRVILEDHQDIRSGFSEINGDDKSITWTIPEMKVYMENELAQFSTPAALLGNMWYWIEFSKQDDGVYGIYLRVSAKKWHFNSQPSFFNTIKFTFQNNPRSERMLHVGDSRFFRHSAVWRGIIGSGIGWRQLIGLSADRAQIVTDENGQLVVKIQFIREREMQGRGHTPINVKRETRPMVTN